MRSCPPLRLIQPLISPQFKNLSRSHLAGADQYESTLSGRFNPTAAGVKKSKTLHDTATDDSAYEYVSSFLLLLYSM